MGPDRLRDRRRVAVPYFYQRMDNEIRCRVEELFAKHYPGLQVKVRSAALMKGEGISIRGLTIVDPAAEGPGGELLNYDECFIACPTDLSGLLSGELRPTRIVVRRPTLRMTRRGDGTWSAARLLPLPRFTEGAMPEVRVENGTIEVFDPTKSPACTTTFRDVNLSFSPIPPPAGQPETTRRRRVQGTATGDYFRQVIFDGEVDIDRPALNIAGKIEGMEISPEVHNTLADLQGCKLSLLASLRGETEAHFQVSYDPAAEERWKFDVDGQLAHGRFEDPRLPHHPLTEIQATVHVDNRGFSIRDFTARSNQAALSLTCSGGLSAASPMDIEGEIRQLPLDEQLMAVLPGDLQEHWRKLHPQGVIDAYVKLHFDGSALRPRVRVNCQNVTFMHDVFRYQLERGNGPVELKDDRLTFDIHASSENQPIHLFGEIRNPFTGATGWLRANCNALPLDKKLLEALRPEMQPLAASLDLRGAAAVDLELSQEVANGPLHKHIRAWPDRCSLCYKDFPVAVSKIVGQAETVPVEMVDGNWWFRNLEGYNGTSRITGDGTFFRSPGGNELVLRLNAGNVPLDRELRDALPAGMGQAWTMLQPRGIIDLTADVHYLSRGNILEVGVRAEPRSDTCSLEPVQFPYGLENVQGVFTYGGGRLSFERFSAWHGPVKLACNGTCSFQPDGGWQLRLDRVTVDRLRLDRQFMQILPPQLKKNLGELNVTGPISLHDGSMVVDRAGDPKKPTVAKWSFPLDLNQVGVDCGVRLENIFGSVRINGWSDGTRFQMRGEMAIESMTYRDLQLTEVMGPFWIDEQKAMFGSWVAQQDNQSLPRGQPPAAPRPRGGEDLRRNDLR